MAPVPVSPLNIALGHLETAERDLAEQLAVHVTAADALRLELDIARQAIAGLRQVGGHRLPAAPPPVVPPAPRSPVSNRRRSAGGRSGPVVLAKGHAGIGAARARSLAVLQLLVDRPRSAFELRAALPVPAGATPKQHTASVSNALNRMKGDGLVARHGEEWAATAKGRKSAAAPAAKEAP